MPQKIRLEEDRAMFCSTHPLLAETDRTESENWTLGCVLFASYGNTIVKHWRSLSPTERSRVFDLVERLIRDGESLVGDAAATGLLEAVVHSSDRGDIDFREVAPLLGPQSKAHCIGYDSFHGCRTPGLYP
jgi:hypothetical protein